MALQATLISQQSGSQQIKIRIANVEITITNTVYTACNHFLAGYVADSSVVNALGTVRMPDKMAVIETVIRHSSTTRVTIKRTISDADWRQNMVLPF
jgi:hypothetical protein